MFVKIILKCSKYDNEYSVQMLSEMPDFHGNVVIGDTVLYEDAAYTGYVSVYNADIKDIQEIHIFRNNTIIGQADMNKSTLKIDGNGKQITNYPIQFMPSVVNNSYAQPFLLQCDFIILSAVIVLKSDKKGKTTKREFFSPYQLCVSKDIADTNNVEQMIQHLLSEQDSRVTSLMYGAIERTDTANDTLIEGSYSETAKKSILAYVKMVENTMYTYKKEFTFFSNNAKHSVKKTAQIHPYDKIRTVSPSSVQWLGKNMDVLTRVKTEDGIRVGYDSYMPVKLYTEITETNSNVYENRVIVGFLFTMSVGIGKMVHDLEQGITEEEYLLNRMINITEKSYTAPIITIKRVHLHHMHGILDKIKKMRQEIQNIYQIYRKAILCDFMAVTKVPHMTKTFQEIKSYHVIYRHIIEWFKYGEMDLEKNGALFQIKTIDKLFEYYCLSNMISSVLNMGYKPKENRPSYSFPYSGYEACSKFQNEKEVANTYEFTKDGKTLRLYYQPVIFSYTFENRITLFRTTGNRDIYTPDFCLQMSVNEKNPKYAIFDAKYSSLANIKKYYIPELLRKYDTNIGDQYSTDAVKMMWILRGRMDEISIPVDDYQTSPMAVKYNNNLRIHAGATSVNTSNKGEIYGLMHSACNWISG